MISAVMVSSFINFVTAQSGGNSLINWYEWCTNPIVDILLSEACSTLMKDGGYTLTKGRERVLDCIGGGALALVQLELMALKSLAPCGSNYSTGSSNSHTNVFQPTKKTIQHVIY